MMLMFYLEWSGDKYGVCKYSGSGKNFNFVEVPLDAIIVSKDTSTERIRISFDFQLFNELF